MKLPILNMEEVKKKSTEELTIPKKEDNNKKESKKEPLAKPKEDEIVDIPKKSIRYRYADKPNIIAAIIRGFPKELKMTYKTGYLLGFIFLFVIIWALATFPYGSFMSGNNLELEIKVGIPYTFLEFSVENPEESPIRIKGLIIDIILYTLIAYIIDVLINYLIKGYHSLSKEEQEKKPEIFRDRKLSVAEKATDALFGGIKGEKKDKKEKKEEKSTTEELKIPEIKKKEVKPEPPEIKKKEVKPEPPELPKKEKPGLATKIIQGRVNTKPTPGKTQFPKEKHDINFLRRMIEKLSKKK